MLFLHFEDGVLKGMCCPRDGKLFTQLPTAVSPTRIPIPLSEINPIEITLHMTIDGEFQTKHFYATDNPLSIYRHQHLWVKERP